MSFSAYWESFCSWIQWIGLPVVALYHILCSSIFLNVTATDARGMEKWGDYCLTPVHYVLAGQKASPKCAPSGECLGYCFTQEFSYKDVWLWPKTIAAYLVSLPSLVIGSTLKGVAYLSPEVRQRGKRIATSLLIESKNAYYASLGISYTPPEQAEYITCEGYPRRPEDKQRLLAEKAALKEVIRLLEEHQIIYWLDCGTCLGAYRHGGAIPWDWDIDLAILQPDFDNVRSALSHLDPQKYCVQDWSSRDRPKSYLKVYVKDSHTLIDIYHFALFPEEAQMRSIVANENSIFLPESWKIRERRYTVPTPFALVFPLKRASFDGIEAFVPRCTKEYLELRYKDISPARVYDAVTEQYEKVAGHSYWQEAHNR